MSNPENDAQMSASQEISLLTRARKLNLLITSMGFQLPLRLFAYDCMHDSSPIGMALMGYEIHVVGSEPINIERLEKYIAARSISLTYDSYPLLELGAHEEQTFDIVLINGVALRELRTDSELQEVCQQLASTIRPDGLLIILSANFDEILRIKERVFRPRMIDDPTARHLHVVVRDWHGNGTEYTETQYIIEDRDGMPRITSQKQQCHAWRYVEITLGLTHAGFENIESQTNEQDQRILIARKTTQTVKLD